MEKTESAAMGISHDSWKLYIPVRRGNDGRALAFIHPLGRLGNMPLVDAAAHAEKSRDMFSNSFFTSSVFNIYVVFNLYLARITPTRYEFFSLNTHLNKFYDFSNLNCLSNRKNANEMFVCILSH